MKYICALLLLCSSVLAQNTISGTLYADNVQGFMVIGCLFDAASRDCNYDQSPYMTVEQPGSSTLFVLENAPEGNYLIIAWKDTNGNGALDETQDDIGYYLDEVGEAAFISPPASDIMIQVSSSNSQPSNSQSSNRASELIGIWQAGMGGMYDPSSDDWGFGDTVETNVGHWYQLNADGSYQSRFGINMVSFGTCRQKILIAESGTYTFQNEVLTLTPTSAQKKSNDNCDDDSSKNYLSNAPLQVSYKLAHFVSDGLELTSLKPSAVGSLEIDPEDSTLLMLRRETP